MHKCALGSNHFVGGSFINISADERASRSEINPEKAGLVHGKIEHQIQRRLSGHSVLRRWFEFFEGDQAMHNPMFFSEWRDKDGNETGVRKAKLRWAWNQLQRCDMPRQCFVKRRYLAVDELVPISNALFALSKLFSGAGDHKRYYLNESDMLKGDSFSYHHIPHLYFPIM